MAHMKFPLSLGCQSLMTVSEAGLIAEIFAESPANLNSAPLPFLWFQVSARSEIDFV